MAKSEFLQIRLTPEDRRRIRLAAEADHLDPSTWARRILLQAVEQGERTIAPSLKNNDSGKGHNEL
jgi:hypothetical protein